MELLSPAFDDGEPIPEQYGYTERNVNPPLVIRDVPPDATVLALVMDDPDAVEPAGKIWDHWVVWNIDADMTEIPEDWNVGRADATEGQNDFGEQGYGGPNPPDRQHTYRFTLYAVDSLLDLDRAVDANDLRTAVEGATLETAELTGTYTP